MSISLKMYRKGMANQRGSTLLVALVMLVMLTLIAISSMNASTSSIQIVGNAQFREEANAAAQQAMEVILSSTGFTKTPPAQQDIDINNDADPDFRVVFTPAPVCVSAAKYDPKTGPVHPDCQGAYADYCNVTVWDIVAVVTDLKGSGATATVRQGVSTITGLNGCGV
jgi:Tfp pilus assembly protein PilX